jgi:hypothetical protein
VPRSLPDDEWFANREASEQRREMAEFFEQKEDLLASGAARRPGSDRVLTAEQEDQFAEERERRRKQLDAAKRTRKNA